MSVSHPEGRVGDVSQDHRTLSQPPTKRDGVSGIKRGSKQAKPLTG